MTTRPASADTGCHGCDEFQRLSRRGFLMGAGALAAAAAWPAWLPRVALARDHNSAQRDVVVSIFLRGGADGLTICPPWGDPAYYAARPTIAIPRPDSTASNRAINLDGFFGLAPALAPLMPAWNNDHLLIVHACGSTVATRSHFAGQFNIESARGSDGSISTGWLGRHLAASAPAVPNPLLRGAGVSLSGLQDALVGGPKTLPVPRDLSTFGINGSLNDPDVINLLTLMFNRTVEPMRTSALDTIATVNLFRSINFNGYSPAAGVVYPQGQFGQSLKHIAALIKAQVGVESVAVDSGSGWDTHALQGPHDGEMASLMSGLASALAAFYADMTSGNAPGVTIVVMTEFGRSLPENGSHGTDHGYAGAMLVLGSCVQGGRVLTDWPGLAPHQLHEARDLKVTTDYRDILAEILALRLGATNLDAVFPGFTPSFKGVVSSC